MPKLFAYVRGVGDESLMMSSLKKAQNRKKRDEQNLLMINDKKRGKMERTTTNWNAFASRFILEKQSIACGFQEKKAASRNCRIFKVKAFARRGNRLDTVDTHLCAHNKLSYMFLGANSEKNERKVGELGGSASIDTPSNTFISLIISCIQLA